MISLLVLALMEHVLAVSHWLGPHLAVKRHHHLACVSTVVIPQICLLALFDTNMCKCSVDGKVPVSLPVAAASVPSSSTVFCAVHCFLRLCLFQRNCLLVSLLYSLTSPSLVLHLFKLCCICGQESAQSLVWWALNPQVSQRLALFITFVSLM